ncbi:hypothetical protein T492DRAFT_1066213 [Pavlovales sp. CCMP2436]|nr:hypothetical protein T492DRAFT_1066213 [Pavlovales sp. CCMP2436]
MPASPSARWACGLLGVFLGLSAFVGTNLVTKSYMAPVIEACSAGPDAVAKAGLHAYEGRIGGQFACIVTQFIYDLSQRPAGVLVWGVIIGISFPISLALAAEAGRAGAHGPVLYPTLVMAVSQVLGISVGFPLFWIPGFAYGGASGALAPGRVWVAIALLPVAIILTLLVFVVDPASPTWTLSAGLLTSPLIALPQLLLLAYPAPPKDAPPAAYARGQHALVSGYTVLFLLSLVAWVLNVTLAAKSFSSLGAVWDSLWPSAHPSVAFMTIDTVVLYAGLLVYIFLGGAAGAMGAVLLTPFVGPGAACSLVLALRERARAELGPEGAKRD